MSSSLDNFRDSVDELKSSIERHGEPLEGEVKLLSNGVDDYVSHKKIQTQALLASYFQKRAYRADRLDGVKDMALQRLSEQLDRLSPNSLIRAIEVLSKASIDELVTLSGSSGASADSLLNLTINNNNGSPDIISEASDGDSMSAMRSLARIRTAIVDGDRAEKLREKNIIDATTKDEN